MDTEQNNTEGETMTEQNYYKTSDIKLHKDSVGFYDADHKFQGMLMDGEYFETRNEARREAVKILMEQKEQDELDKATFEEFEGEETIASILADDPNATW